MRSRMSGLTMIELLAVMAVFSVLTLMWARNETAKMNTVQVDHLAQRAISVSEAAKYFRQHTGTWPATINELISNGMLVNHPGPGIPTYESQFSIIPGGANAPLQLSYTAGEARIARRVAGVLPNGELVSGSVRFLVERPGFEASLSAVLDDFYRRDGSQPLTGSMDAGGHDISNVRHVTGRRFVSDEDSGFFVDPSNLSSIQQLWVDGNVETGSHFIGNRLRDRTNTNYIRLDGDSRLPGELSVGTLQSRGNATVNGTLTVNNHLGSPGAGTVLANRLDGGLGVWQVTPSAHSQLNSARFAGNLTASSMLTAEGSLNVEGALRLPLRTPYSTCIAEGGTTQTTAGGGHLARDSRPLGTANRDRALLECTYQATGNQSGWRWRPVYSGLSYTRTNLTLVALTSLEHLYMPSGSVALPQSVLNDNPVALDIGIQCYNGSGHEFRINIGTTAGQLDPVARITSNHVQGERATIPIGPGSTHLYHSRTFYSTAANTNIWCNGASSGQTFWIYLHGYYS